MTKRQQEDAFERVSSTVGGPRASASALPAEEPAGPDAGTRARDLEAKLAETEATLRYMGRGHPRRAELEARRQFLRGALADLRTPMSR